jgi:hypothetical protein
MSFSSLSGPICRDRKHASLSRRLIGGSELALAELGTGQGKMAESHCTVTWGFVGGAGPDSSPNGYG